MHEMPRVGRSRLVLRRRISPAALLLRGARFFSTFGLILALVLGGYRFITRPISVGALEFSPHIVGIETGAVGVLGIDASDLDEDGDIDIFTAGGDGVKVYIQDGDHNFEQKLIDDQKSERILLIDLDADGDQDVLVQLRDGPGVKWYENKGGMEFTGQSVGTNEVKAFAAGDIDGDGAADIVMSTDEGGSLVLRRWLNNGSGSFTSATLNSDSKVTAIAIGDVNDNDLQEIVTGGENGLQFWSTDDGSTWSRADIDDGKPNSTHIVIADMDGDGGNDIVTGDQGGNVVAVYNNIQHSQFQRTEFSGDADALTVDPVDLDEDGDEDVLVAAQDDNSIYWFDNTGDEGFTKRTVATGLQSVFGVKAVDVDGDNDFDFIAGDHFQGTVWWYERTAAKPVATAPSSIAQSTNGSGNVTFKTTISDGDFDTTKFRVQYSTNGSSWGKPWLTKATIDNGTADLRNSNGYQVGTNNALDTDTNDSVEVTLTWDTKSSQNTAGPIVGDIGTVQLRIIPHDGTGTGDVAVSSKFRVDNSGPADLDGFAISSISEDQATLTWSRANDSGSFAYRIYYGTDHTKVLEQRSEVWDSSDDASMEDVDTTSTTITGLTPDQTYTFKIFASDDFGNTAAAPSVSGVTSDSVATSPTPTATPVLSPTPETSPSPTATPSAVPTVSPSPLFSPVPSPTGPPLTTENNRPPFADAGLDQEVNPSALVILDGSASFDPDNDALRYSWQQVSGPRIDLLSERTVTPSFSAGGEGEAYIFTLTVRDAKGASATDDVTIVTKVLPPAVTTPVEVSNDPIDDVSFESTSKIAGIFQPIDIALFFLALLSTVLSLVERMLRRIRDRSNGAGQTRGEQPPTGRVVHHRTGDPIAGARVMIYGADGKLRHTARTTIKGEFETLFPAGEYTMRVEAEGFVLASVIAGSLQLGEGLVYTGGKLNVPGGGRPLKVIIPMKPTGKEVSSVQIRLLHLWQSTQRIGRALSWPVFVMGALINTGLIFVAPGVMFLVLEVLYVVLVIVKVALEVRVRPAYGLVRDAITHVPLDLAVVRLFEAGTNRLVMTRVTNAQGKFFALPPAATYTVTVTKPGYAVFSKDKVRITSEQDSVLQVTADLMPVTPRGGLQAARAAAI